MVRYQRQPPGTAVTRASLLAGALLLGVAGVVLVAERPAWAGVIAGCSGALLLLGGHRANHGGGGPVDRMLTELFDRAWDAVVLGSTAWVSRIDEPTLAAGALVALCASFLSSYVRARGAALGYSVEESHVTRALRYLLIAGGLATSTLQASVWVAAGVSIAAAMVRSGQVAREERAT